MKNAALQGAKQLGAVDFLSRSSWRQQRLLILCYHGISLKDEHEWRSLYITPDFFCRRLELIRRRNYSVLPLAEALRRLEAGSLPAKSVVLTFDDGFYDFFKCAFPVLQEFGFPATVYQTTYYADYQLPIFNLVLSYIFWRGKHQHIDGAGYGVPVVFDLSNPAQRARAVRVFLEMARIRDYDPAQKNEFAAHLAGRLGVDYDEILRLRMLQLMSPSEIRAIHAAGIDVQLHTHRHRTPAEKGRFIREIRENRAWLAATLGETPGHFCYPSGAHTPDLVSWLREEGVISATTCEAGLATRISDPLLLPRLLDSMQVPEVEFESWLSGFCSFLPHRPVIHKRPVPVAEAPSGLEVPAGRAVR